MALKGDFGRKAANARQASVQILIDGSDNSKAGAALSYLSGMMEKASRRLYPEMPETKYELRTRFLFNPELNGKFFIVPGLVVVIIGLLAILLTSLAIAKEWEKGSMELLLSTHVRPIEIVIGKIIPYFLLSLLGAVSVFYAARAIFFVPFTGSLIVFCFSCCIYIISCLSLGILISVAARQQQLAMMLAMAAGLLPSMLLSGFIFPIENMPLFFRTATFVLPQRWFMEICRGVFLRGAGFADLLLPIGMICLFCVFIIFAAVKKFKTDAEP
jgi:ABC-2 type transport system permease protein